MYWGLKFPHNSNKHTHHPCLGRSRDFFLFFFFQSEHHSENTFKEFRTFDYKNFHLFPPYRLIRIAPDTTSNTDVITTIHLAGNIHIETIPNPRATKQIPTRQVFILLRFKSIPPRNERSLHYTEKSIFLCLSAKDLMLRCILYELNKLNCSIFTTGCY